MQTLTVLQVQVPPGTVEEVIGYCADFQTQAAAAGFLSASSIAAELVAGGDSEGRPGSEFTVEDQIKRFEGFWKKRAPFLRRINDELRSIGYEAVLPETRVSEGKLPPYIRYVDPGDEATFGYTNSGAFTLTRAAATGPIADDPRVERTRDGVRIQFDSDEKVDLILEQARSIKVVRGV